MQAITIKRTAATALVAVAAAGAPMASAHPLVGHSMGDAAPPGGWPDMHASTAIALAERRHEPDPLRGQPRTAVVARSRDGSDWAEAGLGAAGLFSVAAAGGVVVVGRRRRRGYATAQQA